MEERRCGALRGGGAAPGDSGVLQRDRASGCEGTPAFKPNTEYHIDANFVKESQKLSSEQTLALGQFEG